MNYEEKYKKAVQQIRDLLERSKENGWLQMLAFEKDFEQIFPELAESEDERIRKNCIHFLELQKSHHAATFEIKECIDWLKSLKDRIGCEVNCTTTKERKPSDEQKPAGMVEPKFHERDWVIDKQGIIHQIANIEKIVTSQNVPSHIYGYTIVGGGYFNDNAEGVRPWSIQDAKDGDVLAAHECLVLFKEIDGLNIRCYGAYYMGLNPGFRVDTLQNKDAFHPATKEQRDLLFQKMKEAGYKWDGQSKKMLKLN